MTVSAVVGDVEGALTVAGVRVAVRGSARPAVPYTVVALVGQAAGDTAPALGSDRAAGCTVEVRSVGRSHVDACWLDERVFGVLAAPNLSPTVLGVSYSSSPTLMVGEGRLVSAVRRYRFSYTLS